MEWDNFVKQNEGKLLVDIEADLKNTWMKEFCYTCQKISGQQPSLPVWYDDASIFRVYAGDFRCPFDKKQGRQRFSLSFSAVDMHPEIAARIWCAAAEEAELLMPTGD